MLAYPFLTNFQPGFETEEIKKGYLICKVPNAAELTCPAVCSAGHLQCCVAVEPMDGARTALAP